MRNYGRRFGTGAQGVEDPQFHTGVQNLAAPSAKDKIQYFFLRGHLSPPVFSNVLFHSK
jgi:hypothetical protein